MCNSFNKKFLDEAAKHWTEPESKDHEMIDVYMKKAIEKNLFQGMGCISAISPPNPL